MAEGGRVIHRAWQRELEDGRRIQGDVTLPEGSPPRSTVVLVHGFKGFKDWGFFPHLAEKLAEDGHAAVRFNFSLNGIGPRSTEFTELEDFARNTLSRELEEIHLVLEALSDPRILPFPPGRVGLLGHSRGGGGAVLAAAEAPERGVAVDALVTWSAVADFDRWDEETRREWRDRGRIHVLNSRTGQELPLGIGLLEDFESNRERLDIQAAAGRIQAPWLILHGSEDVSVPPFEAERLAGAAPGSARLRLVDGAGHTFGATHPFKGETPHLSRVLSLTRSHFREHLSGA